MRPNKLIVNTQSGTYPIIIGSKIIEKLPEYLKKASINFNKCLLIIDKRVPNRMVLKITKSLKNKKITKYFFKSSEKNKNQISINKILDVLFKKNFSRQDCLITIGGGIAGDVGGFAASLYKRGLKFINIPTTLLSQVDSSIGGKTGINTKQGKNLIGSFYQPTIVFTDIEFLKTLPLREIICGYAEILKHSLIMNKKFFYFLNNNIIKILGLKSPFIESAIFKSCKIKKNVIEKDEKEKGDRKILNFGHTFAHAYEASLGYSKKLNHGEAVILGIISALKFSLNKKIMKKSEYQLIIKHIDKVNSNLKLKNYFTIRNLNKIIFFMLKDKKNISNKINLILLKKIGSTLIDNQYDVKIVKKFLKQEELAN